ncbi:arylsulfatase B-like [Odontomachus brunneus]|uniref:arylsulfatase B-like n=1 Tax=Odontomachus brunneus TaxID=486640 RepID=UPI0013F2355F|nr:arylsulfatase B-like [Odontomachus brunneus]
MGRLLLMQLFFALCLLDALISVTIAILLENSGRTRENDYKKPHIVIILADDLGWNDVGFHGSDQIPTPNIDALAYNGVILNHHYVPALCTPSRAALMTGKYPTHTGMQHSVILPSEPRALPLEEKLLSQYLKEAGYATHIVGKWHLGFYKQKYTPLFRGFDTHFGYWNGLHDYYTHDTLDPFILKQGIDMRRNMTVAWDTRNKYSTDLFTEEAVRLINIHNADDPMFLYLAQIAPHSGNINQLLQAPSEEIEKFSYITDEKRRIYAAMVSKLDQCVGDVIEVLKKRGMLENSIIVFMSDNGAPTNGFLANQGSNYPLRGIKETAWEGGVRGTAAIWSPLIKKRERVSNQLMYMADWLPTLLSVVGVNKEEIGEIDGFDMWPTIAFDEISPREEMVINIDSISKYEAIRLGKYKYVRGQTTSSSEWLGESRKNSTEQQPQYLPETVLYSKAGVAIAEVTAGDNNAILTSQKILELRQEAKVYCNVTEAEKIQCHAWSTPCLFDLERDPCEMINIIEQKPSVAEGLQQALDRHKLTMVPPNNKFFIDPRANPHKWNNTWDCWLDHNPETFIHMNKIIGVYFVTFVAIVFCVFAFVHNLQLKPKKPNKT